MLTRPDDDVEEPDALTIELGQRIDGQWTVARILGTGSTAGFESDDLPEKAKFGPGMSGRRRPEAPWRTVGDMERQTALV